MAFNVGDVVRICDDDLMRGGEFARILTVQDSSQPPIREYVVEFATPPKKFQSDHRFLCCVYREEQLVSEEGARHA
jgi:hypothetical protein